MLKKGFTLAETMITLGILGVLAAILIPSVMKLSPDNNKVMFKKAYYTLERAVTYMINNDTNYPASITTPDGLLKGFNYTKATSNDRNKFCYFLSDMMNIIGSPVCPALGAAGKSDLGSFQTSDGIKWGIYVPVSDTANDLQSDASVCASVQFPINSTCYYTTKVAVDVNGDKGPNCTTDKVRNEGDGTYHPSDQRYDELLTGYCTSGQEPDQFLISVRYDGKLRVGYSSVDHPDDITDQNAIDILQNPTNNTK